MTENVVRIEGVLPEPKRDRYRDTRNTPRPHGDYELEWARCTEEARRLIQQINQNKIQVAKLATQVCDIQWGGGNHWSGHEGVKTLKEFAKEVAMQYKTLTRWVAVYRYVVLPLGEENVDMRNWSALLRAHKRIEQRKRRNRHKDDVKRIYEEEKGRCGSSSMAWNCIKTLTTVRNHFRKIDWENVDEEEQGQIGELLLEIAEKFDSTVGDDEVSDGDEDVEVVEMGGNFDISISELLKTRLIIQANSGGGKTNTIMNLVNGLNSSTVIFDTEGDFLEYGESESWSIFNEDEDDLTSLLHQGQSVVFDMSDMSPSDRRLLVRDYCEELVEQPKGLFSNVFVVIDEAHLYAPQRGHKQGFSKDEKTSCDAVIDLASRGRKRGICLILATQRLAKVHKDAASECVNKMIGRTTLDIDRRRSAQDLQGVVDPQGNDLMMLEPGQFYVFGPAMIADTTDEEPYVTVYGPEEGYEE